MNIKRYRAATMRAALEQVKQELGADALVLETKQVRGGGFLGIGSRPWVELRVAANDQSAVSETVRKNPVSAKTAEAPIENQIPAESFQTPSAKNSPARNPLTTPPPVSLNTANRKTSAYSAMAARMYANEAGNKISETTRKNNFPANKNGEQNSLLGKDPINRGNKNSGIELAETPPRMMRKVASAAASGKSVAEKQTTSRVAKTPPAEVQPQVTETVSGDLSRLREEMRTEMRALSFSMNALVARQVAYGDTVDGTRGQLHETFENDPEVFDSPFYDIYSVLTAAGLRPELARGAVRAGLSTGTRQTRNFETIARSGLVATLPSIVNFAVDPLASAPGSENAPAAIALVGPTGVGKTTTIAKLAARVVCRLHRRVVLVTLDTYRIAATEQLRIYAEIIGANFHVAHSIAELDALVRRFSGEATVLIDTAGRSPAEITDEMELGNYLRACDDILKLLVLPATTHPVDAHTAIRQFSLFGPDQLILTKMDETTRPGATVSVAGDAAIPLAYLCSGQRVPEDLERATPLAFAARIVRASFAIQES